MLRRMKIHYRLTTKGDEKERLKTHRRLAQKFGHIHVIIPDDWTTLDELFQMIETIKPFNIKLSITARLSFWQSLLDEDQGSFLELIESLDMLGIEMNDLSIDFPSIELISELVFELNGNVELWTELTEANVSLSFNEAIESLSYDRWLISTTLEDKQVEEFISRHNHLPIIKDESPFYVNHRGELFTSNHKRIESIFKPNKPLMQAMEQASPAFQNWLTQIKELPYKLNRTYIKKLFYKITSGKAAFFDIEAISRKLTNVAKHNMKEFPIPILYALIVIEEGELRIRERFSYSVTDHTNLKSIYAHFFKTIKQAKIDYLVVSGGDLERKFIENTMYALKDQLSLDDFRYLFRLRDQLIDIQTIIPNHHYNSYKLLMEFQTLYPDLITHYRKSDKMSIKMNFILDGLIFGPKRDSKTLNKMIHYCFEDVIADFELFKFYCYVVRYNIK